MTEVLNENGRFILFDLSEDIESKLQGVPHEKLSAVFIGSDSSEGVGGLESFAEYLKKGNVDHPIPTYMTEATLLSLMESGRDLRHLDQTIIRGDTETFLDELVVYASGDEKQLQFKCHIEPAGGIEYAEMARQAFGSPGGKKNTAKKIVPLIPRHSTYVEPFAGGAAIYFNKKKVGREILADLNKSITNSYRFIRDGSDEDFTRAVALLQRSVSKPEFFKIRERVEKGIEPTAEGFTEFYKLTYYSFGMDRRSYGYIERTPSMSVSTLQGLRERLQGSTVLNNDAVSVIKKYDSPQTFFYLDPPYPENWRGKEDMEEFTMDKFQELINVLSSLQGKFILSINNSKEVRKRLDPKFKLRRIKTRRSVENRKHVKHKTEEFELIVSNYDLEMSDEFSLSESEPQPESDSQTQILIPNFVEKEGNNYDLALILSKSDCGGDSDGEV